MRPVLYLLSSAFAATAGCVLAQQTPSDIELRAAYCLGYLVNSSASMEGHRKSFEAKRSGEKDALEMLKKLERDAEDRLQRVRAYILPRSASLEQSAIMFALDRGRGDYALAGDEMHACLTVPGCEMDRVGCFDRCRKTELQLRVARCNDLSWLPF